MNKIQIEESKPDMEELAANLDGCCTPVGEPMEEALADDLSTMFKALGNPVRLQIFEMLSRHSGDLCVCDIEGRFDLAQPTISHHLRSLRRAGLIRAEKRATWIYYRVEPVAAAALTGFLSGVAAQLEIEHEELAS